MSSISLSWLRPSLGGLVSTCAGVSSLRFVACWDLLIRGEDGSIDQVEGEDDWMIIGSGGGELGTPVVVPCSGSLYTSLSCLCAFWTLGQDRLTASCLPPQFVYFRGLC